MILMMKTNPVQQNYQSYYQGHEQFISSIRDIFRRVEKRNMGVLTSFLSPVEVQILSMMAPSTISVVFDGGYLNAERKVACLCPLDSVPFCDVVCLIADVDSRFSHISHSDILGALMNLGIERNVLGDLIVYDNKIYIFVKAVLVDYIVDNCKQIRNIPVCFSREYDCIDLPRFSEEIQINVSGYRADCIVSALAKCSRKQATELIHRGFVKRNDIVLEENKQLCNNDYVSIRKVGRFRLLGQVATTRKKRMVLRFEKFI